MRPVTPSHAGASGSRFAVPLSSRRKTALAECVTATPGAASISNGTIRRGATGGPTVLIMCLAGPEAQRRYSPRSWRSVHGASDYAQVVDPAVRINGSSEAAGAHVRWQKIVTRDCVVAANRETRPCAVCARHLDGA
jgi:hypothetical protein